MKRLLPMANSSEVGCAVGERTATRSFYHKSSAPIACNTPNTVQDPSLPSETIHHHSHGRYETSVQMPNLTSAPRSAKTHLQHVQQGRLACIIETEEEQLGMLV